MAKDKELKTLKDIFKFKGRYIEEKELKVLAVKYFTWFLDNEVRMNENDFMDFLDITEEDLNDAE